MGKNYFFNFIGLALFLAIFSSNAYAYEDAVAFSVSDSSDEVAYLAKEAVQGQETSNYQASSAITHKSGGLSAVAVMTDATQALTGKMWLLTIAVSIVVASMLLRKRSSSYGYW